MSAAVAFDGSKHPRGDHGRFSAAGQGVYTGPARPLSLAEHRRRRDARLHSLGNRASVLLRDNPQQATEHSPAPALLHGEGRPVFDAKRSPMRSTSAWRTGSKIHELPIAYTGRRERELPVGGYEHIEIQDQHPQALSAEEHHATKRGLLNLIQNLREPIVAAGHAPKRKGKLRGRVLIPEGTERRTINRAYNHAAGHALHGFGVMDYSYKMSPELKDELTPMVDFMRFTKRRLMDAMLATHKGGWRPYRAEFGRPFNDNRRDKVTGAIRLRVRPNDQLIKMVLEDGYAGLEKAFEESKHRRARDGQFTSGGGAPAAEGPERLAQPAQLAGGALAAGLLTHATGQVTKKPIARIADVVGRRAAAQVRLGARQSGALKHGFEAEQIMRSQSKMARHIGRIGIKGVLGASAGLAAGLAGDYLGDYAARRITGAKGKDDEYRHASLIGMGTGMLGMALGHKAVGSRLWRPLRYNPVRRGLSGLGAAVAGAVGAEVGGNLVDEKVHATDLIAGVNRRTVARFSGQRGG